VPSSGDTIPIQATVAGVSGWPPGASAVWVAADYATREEILRLPAELVDPDVVRVTLEPEDTAELDGVTCVQEFQVTDPLGVVQTVAPGPLVIDTDFA